MQDAFFEAIKKEASRAQTENGGACYASTASACRSSFFGISHPDTGINP